MTDSVNFAERLLDIARAAGAAPPERRWKAGDFLYRQGFPTGGLLVLTGGLTKASILAANGAEVLVCLMGPGRILGDVEYFRAIPAVRKACPDFDLILGRALAAKLAENAERFESSFCYPLDYNMLADLTGEGLIRAEGGAVIVADERAVRARIARTEEE